MKIRNYTMSGRKIMLVAHVQRDADNGDTRPVFDLYNVDAPENDGIACGMTLDRLVDTLMQMRQDIDDLIYEYGDGDKLREPMLRTFAETWSRSHAD